MEKINVNIKDIKYDIFIIENKEEGALVTSEEGVSVFTSLKDALTFKIYDEKLKGVYIDLESIVSLDNKEFFDGFSYVMQLAMVKSEVFYFSLIDEMYEICEKESDTLLEVLKKALEMRVLITKLDIEKNNEVSVSSFGYPVALAIKKYKKDELSFGECLSLGCVATGFISYKKNWLTKEEYYELRDMYVPFYLPISIEMLDIDKLLDLVTSELSGEDDKYKMVLLKKTGKTVLDNTVTSAEIKEALSELNFDEAW